MKSHSPGAFILKPGVRARAAVARCRAACAVVTLAWTALAGAVHAQTVEVAGISEPVMDSTMAFPATGIVAARHFPEGATVKKGQVLIELEKRLEELDVARRKLAKQLAATELNRLETLAGKNTISVSREEIDKKRTEAEIAMIELELSEEMLRRRQIVAPVDGQIARYFKQVGEACDEERAPVVRVVDTRTCYFVADCEGRAWQRLKLEQRVKLQFDGRDGVVEVEGSVHYIAPVVDPASGLLRVKVLFDNPDQRIRPGIAGRMIVP